MEVAGPYGPVRLAKTGNRIVACYFGQQLVNGSVGEYTLQLREAALQIASTVRLPWRSRPDGSIEVLDHELFYSQSFSLHLQALERLSHWIESPGCSRD